jgi:hypothetical protein
VSSKQTVYKTYTYMISRSNKETSYICPYTAWVGDSAVVLAAHKTISRACNSKAKYGWVRLHGTDVFSGDAPPDFSIGRTWRGNDFCADGHAPPDNPHENDEGSLDLRDGLHDHSETAVAQLAIPDHLRDQGDGFYSAIFDDTGKINVTFTPKDVLLAGKPAHAYEKRDLPQQGSYGHEYHCGPGASGAWRDLGWACDELAKKVNGVHYRKNSWQWVHK